MVGCEDVLVRARPVGQQRARDGGLRLRVLRACRAVVSQQRVYLRQGVVGQQRGRDGAGRLRVLRCPCAVVSQQRVYLRRGVVGQQGCCYSGVSARRGVAVCRDAQRVVAVGQRSREIRLQTTLLPRTSSQVVKPAQAGALTTPPLPESCRAASSAWSRWPRARRSWRMRPAASRRPWPPGAP